MDSLPNFLTHGAPLRARFAREELRYYMLNHRIRGLLFQYKKKKLLFAIDFHFLVRVLRKKHPDSVCQNDVNSEQNVRKKTSFRALHATLLMIGL